MVFVKPIKIAVIGLGYVGLPLARLFSTKYECIGFDLNQSRVDALNSGHDMTLEVSDDWRLCIIVCEKEASDAFPEKNCTL